MAIRIAKFEASEKASEKVVVYGYELFVETSFVGCVVSVGEHNGYDDSDFYAIVWDAEMGDFREVTYASTRGWTYGNSATVDAPAELVEKYRAKCAAEAAARELARAKRDVRPGAEVVVIKGRKVPKGSKGTVTWFGPDKFRRGAKRAGVRFEGVDGVTFVDAANLEVVVA